MDSPSGNEYISVRNAPGSINKALKRATTISAAVIAPDAALSNKLRKRYKNWPNLHAISLRPRRSMRLDKHLMVPVP